MGRGCVVVWLCVVVVLLLLLCCCCWFVVVVVEWLTNLKEQLLLEWLTLANFFVASRPLNVCFCFKSNEKCHFSSENDDLPKRVVDFLRERDTFRNKIMEIVEDFDTKRSVNLGNRRGLCV